MGIPLSLVLARPLAARRARQPVRRPPRSPRHLHATLRRTSLHRPAPSRSPEPAVAISTQARSGSRCHPRPLATSPMYPRRSSFCASCSLLNVSRLFWAKACAIVACRELERVVVVQVALVRRHATPIPVRPRTQAKSSLHFGLPVLAVDPSNDAVCP